MVTIPHMGRPRAKLPPAPGRLGRVREAVEAALDQYETYTALADALGVTRAAITQWCSGDSENIRWEHLFSLCEIANMSVAYVAMGYGPKGPYRATDELLEIAGILSGLDPAKRQKLTDEILAFARFRASAA